MSPDSLAISTPLIALVGNPNAGKTTLFNALTGSHQKVGNYPGVTVEKVTGRATRGGTEMDFLDVPGMYSLDPVSEDERVAVEALLGVGQDARKPDLVICVIDATNLERNLYMFAQIAGLRVPCLVALTMVDRVTASGQSVDLNLLSSLVGVQVVPIVGHKDRGIDELFEAIAVALHDKPVPSLSRPSEAAPEPVDLHRIGEDVSARFEWSSQVSNAVIRRAEGIAKRSTTDKIDSILTNRVFGFVIFVAFMYVVFQSIYTFSKPIQDGITAGFGKVSNFLSPHLAGVPALRSLVTDGIIGGVGGVLVFLPQIVILFFFIAVLEGTGYLARAAFLMDRLLGWCGLNGRAFIPLLSSFACAIPGIMSARVMPDPKSRLATIMVAPLMSCSARLPVYIVVIGTLIEPKYGAFWAGFTLFAMHFLGLLVAIPVVYIFNRKIFRGTRLPFLLELPPYQWPKWRDVWIAMYIRARIFVQTAGTIIVAMSVVIWALSYFPHGSTADRTRWEEEIRANHDLPDSTVEQFVEQRQLANSVLGRFGKAIEPAFVPLGFDWRITTSILAAFPARETVVPSMGILFSLGAGQEGESKILQHAMADAKWPDGRPLFNLATSIGLMVFFALCAQCFSTLATVRRETNSVKWPVVMFVYMTALAYIGALIVQLGFRWFG